MNQGLKWHVMASNVPGSLSYVTAQFWCSTAQQVSQENPWQNT